MKDAALFPLPQLADDSSPPPPPRFLFLLVCFCLVFLCFFPHCLRTTEVLGKKRAAWCGCRRCVCCFKLYFSCVRSLVIFNLFLFIRISRQCSKGLRLIAPLQGVETYESVCREQRMLADLLGGLVARFARRRRRVKRA